MKTLPFLLLVLLSGLLTLAPTRAQVYLRPLDSPNPQYDAVFCITAGVPDTDGDGRGEVLVGAWREDVGTAADAGRAYLYNGATGARLRTLTSPNVEAGGAFGIAVAGLPDLDRDGRGELLVGAEREDVGALTWAGRAYLYSGATNRRLTLTSPNAQISGRFGFSVAAVPDANGDGRADFLIGAIQEGEGGRAYLFSGRTGTAIRTLVSPNEESGGVFGHTVSAVPDADGDGKSDLLVGAIYESPNGLSQAGRAYLFSGATGALLHTLESPNPEAGGHFGLTVSGVPDTDGDGRGDLLVGGYYEDRDGVSDAGRAYLFSGATGALLHTLGSHYPEASATFGGALGVSDLDGDGLGDLFVSAEGETRYTLGRAGQAYLFSGATGQWRALLVSPRPEADAYFGFPADVVPDVDGDGREDFVVGACGETSGGVAGAGRVYLYGSSCGGPAPAPRSAEAPAEAEATALPSASSLAAPAPNPSTGHVALGYTLGTAGPVRLSVYDALGRQVAVVVDEAREAGAHEASLDTSAMASGVYVVRLEVGDFAEARRFVVAR
jgi:hypothetical protein